LIYLISKYIENQNPPKGEKKKNMNVSCKFFINHIRII
jgi:hypothetical protein